MRMLQSPWSTLCVVLAALVGCGGSPNKGTLPTGTTTNDEVSTPMTSEDVEASEDEAASDSDKSASQADPD